MIKTESEQIKSPVFHCPILHDLAPLTITAEKNATCTLNPRTCGCTQPCRIHVNQRLKLTSSLVLAHRQHI